MDVPKPYRRLLVTYPARWREMYGDGVLSTLLDLHEAIGRRRPSPGERIAFIASGLLRWLPGRTRPPSRPVPAGGEQWHLFDQANAVVDVDHASGSGESPAARHRRISADLAGASEAIVWGTHHV